MRRQGPPRRGIARPAVLATPSKPWRPGKARRPGWRRYARNMVRRARRGRTLSPRRPFSPAAIRSGRAPESGAPFDPGRRVRAKAMIFRLSPLRADPPQRSAFRPDTAEATETAEARDLNPMGWLARAKPSPGQRVRRDAMAEAPSVRARQKGRPPGEVARAPRWAGKAPQAQCDISVATRVSFSVDMVVPPKMRWRSREWPKPPITRRSAPRSVAAV